MRTSVVALVAQFLMSLALAADLQSPDEFLRAARRDGPAQFSRSLPDTPAYARLIEGVGTGDRQWLAVAGLVRPHVDAGFASELEAALIAALARAPDSVVLFLSKYRGPSYTFVVSSICGDGMFQEPQEHHEQVLKVLRAVRSPAAPGTMKQCIAAAEAAARGPRRQ